MTNDEAVERVKAECKPTYGDHVMVGVKARDLRHLISRYERMEKALELARWFIINGTELGFIRMPDPSTPDPAHETLPAIEAALSNLGAPHV